MQAYSLQHRNTNLYCCIASESQFSKGLSYLKQKIFITGAPLEWVAHAVSHGPPLDPTLSVGAFTTQRESPWTRKSPTFQNFKWIVTLQNFRSPAKKWKIDHKNVIHSKSKQLHFNMA